MQRAAIVANRGTRDEPFFCNLAGVSYIKLMRYAHVLKIKSCVTLLDAFSQKARGFTAILVLIAAESIDWKMNLSSKFR